MLASDGAGSPSAGETPAAGATVAPDDGADPTAAERFAAAWELDDREAQYALLAPESQRATPFEAFSAVYGSFWDQAGPESLSVSVVDQDAARATLRVSLGTAYFGPLEWTTSLDLTGTGAGQRVLWSRASIHPQLEAGSEFLATILRPARGAIYDRDGVALAITQDVRWIGLNRSLVLNRATVTDALIAAGFTREAIDAAFDSPLGASQRVPVGTIPDDRVDVAAELIRTAPGVIVWFEPNRVHPLGPAAAHVVGYTREYTAEELEARAGSGLRPGDRLGAVGLEATLDDVLAGQVGARLEIIGGSEGTVLVFEQPFVEGVDVTTTLDAAVLQTAYEGLGERPGAAVVLDPRTNAILAMNSSPSFDPDAFERGDPVALATIAEAENQPLADRAQHGLYSAGSTFKLITGAAGLVEGGYVPASTIYCGAIWYGVDPPRRNWEGDRGPLTIAGGLQRSCNPVFYEIALTLYNTTDGALSEMARTFGYGSVSGAVGLDDAAGLVPDAAWKSANRGEPWYPGDNVNLGIGQGALLITPLQLANAYSAFVARELRAPIILAGESAASRGALPLTDEQWAHLQHGLELVTSSGGTASWAFSALGYHDFAGKSGTAEDSDNQQHVLFAAYSPRTEPRALAAAIFEDGHEDAALVSPLARDLVLAALAAE